MINGPLDQRLYLVAGPGNGVLAYLVRLGHDLDTTVLVVFEDVAVHLKGKASIGCRGHKK